jgi:hypothetical protein
MKTTYTKLRDGSWGLRSEDTAIKEGAPVEVTLKSGETKPEIAGKQAWKGIDRDGKPAALYSIQRDGVAPAVASGGAREDKVAAIGGVSCPECRTIAEPHHRYCWSCGLELARPVKAVIDAKDIPF